MILWEGIQWHQPKYMDPLLCARASPTIPSHFHTSSKQGQSCFYFTGKGAEAWLRKAGLLCWGHLANWGQSWIPSQVGLTSTTLHAALPQGARWCFREELTSEFSIARWWGVCQVVCQFAMMGDRHSRGKQEQGQWSRAGRKFGKSRESPKVLF